MVALKRAFDDEDTVETTPDTEPTAEEHNELVEAVEWLKAAGIVSAERPPFSRFFDELVESPRESARVTTQLSGEGAPKRALNDD